MGARTMWQDIYGYFSELFQNKLIEVALVIIKVFGQPLLVLLGGLFGAKWGIDAYRKSLDHKINEAQAAAAWTERQLVEIKSEDWHVLKAYFNRSTKALYELHVNPGSEGRTKERAENFFVVQDKRMQQIITNIGKSVILKEKWEAFQSSKEKLTELFGNSDLDGRSRLFDAAFAELRAAWLIFYASASPRPYDQTELSNILFMGISKSVFVNSESERDGRNPMHPNGQTQTHKAPNKDRNIRMSVLSRFNGDR